MKNVNQQAIKILEERQAELYDVEDKLYEQMRAFFIANRL